ncbi:MAG: biopolymer transporter ExbD [Alphaproteobacteria bacterium]|nr:biopolymer transporter ExbD [Alphaproteobacteria bacterium]
MAFSSPTTEDRPLSEINVTPLVDVMLVLLVIFIVCAPLMAQSLRVTLPAAAAEPLTESRRAAVTLTAEGALLLDGQPRSAEALTADLTSRLTAEPTLVVELAADGALAYERVARTVSLLRQAGATRLAFATRGQS